MAQKVGYKSDGLKSALLEPRGDCAGYVQIIIKYIPPHSSACFGFEQGVGTREVVRVQVETHHAGSVNHFSNLMHVSRH